MLIVAVDRDGVLRMVLFAQGCELHPPVRMAAAILGLLPGRLGVFFPKENLHQVRLVRSKPAVLRGLFSFVVREALAQELDGLGPPLGPRPGKFGVPF